MIEIDCVNNVKRKKYSYSEADFIPSKNSQEWNQFLLLISIGALIADLGQARV